MDELTENKTKLKYLQEVYQQRQIFGLTYRICEFTETNIYKNKQFQLVRISKLPGGVFVSVAVALAVAAVAAVAVGEGGCVGVADVRRRDVGLDYGSGVCVRLDYGSGVDAVLGDMGNGGGVRVRIRRVGVRGRDSGVPGVPSVEVPGAGEAEQAEKGNDLEQ